MTCRNDETKTYFSQWGPPALLFGLFAAFGIGAFLFTVFFQNPQRGPAYGMLIIPVIFFILWNIFFWRIRFERERGVIVYCSIFPVRIDYADVSEIRYIFNDPKHPDSPTMVIFQLRSGKMKQWNIHLFSPAVRQKIVQEMGARIPLPEHPQEIPDIQKCVDRAVRTSRVEKAIFCFWAVFMLILGFCSMCSQLAWNDRVKNWDKADGIILKNTTKRVKSGKFTKRVADVEYKYTHKGKPYFGTKIVYDSESFPDLKPGAHRQVIVNPENPQDCAIMFYYRGHWGWMRYLNCALLYLVSVFLFAVFFRTLVPKKIVVPEALKTYIATFSAEQFYAAQNKEHPGAMLSRVEMRSPMEYRQEGRYGILRKRDSKASHILFGALLILAITLSFVIPLCWIVVIILGFVIYSMYFSRMTVFDFQEEKIFCCRRFRPEESGQMKSVPFTDIDHFSLSALSLRRQEKSIGLFAVKHDGTNVPLCKVNMKRLVLLLELLPELAEKTGHLPITYF